MPEVSNEVLFTASGCPALAWSTLTVSETGGVCVCVCVCVPGGSFKYRIFLHIDKLNAASDFQSH